MNKPVNKTTYRVSPEVNGRGSFYFTDCGHRMYSVCGPEAFHGKLCPGCLYKDVVTILYIRGSKEANDIMEVRKNEQYN